MACLVCDYEWREAENWTFMNRLKEGWNRAWFLFFAATMWTVVAFVAFALVLALLLGAGFVGLGLAAVMLGPVVIVMYLIFRTWIRA
jgi:hypothetical protein